MEKAIQTLLPGFFILITVVILGMLVYLTLKGVKEQRANDAAPIVTVEAKVKAKRIAVHHSAHQHTQRPQAVERVRDQHACSTSPISGIWRTRSEPPSAWRATGGWSCK